MNEENDCKECNEKAVSSTTLWNKEKQGLKKSKRSIKQQSVRPSNLTQLPLESIHKNASDLNTKEGFETDEQQKMISDSFNTNSSSISMDKIKEYLKGMSSYIAIIAGYPMKIINKITWTISFYLCKILSKKSTEKNIELVKSRLKILLSILISFYIIYNWYFVMFFKNLETGMRIPVIDLSMKTLMQIKPLNYIFKYILCTLSTVDWLLITKYPTIMKDFTPQLNMILLLLIIICVVITMGENIMEDFSTYLSGGKTGYTGSFIAFSVFYGIYSFVQELSNEVVGEPSIMSLINTYFLVNHYRNFGILHVISYIFRIIWSTMIHYLWGLLMVVYIFIMSFFAIFIYSKDSLFETIKQINTFINDNEVIKEDSIMTNLVSGMDQLNELVPPSVPGLDISNKLNPLGKLGKFNKFSKLLSTGSKMKSFFDSFIHIIFKYLFELIILISLLYTIGTYGTNIDNVELKTSLISLNVSFILLVIGYIYHKYTLLHKMMVHPSPDG